MPPMSWTSKWRISSLRFAISRQTAKASVRMSSSVTPSARRFLNSSAFARRSRSESRARDGSLALISATSGWRRLSSRSFLLPKILLSRTLIMLRLCPQPLKYTELPRAKKQRFPVVDPYGSLGENEGMQGERGNIGIFILIHLLVAILVGFFLWSIFPEPWREFLRNGPWGIVAVVVAGGIIVFSIVRGELARRAHKRAHDRVAKVFRETTDPALQKRAALWLVDHDRDHPERLTDAGSAPLDVLLRFLKSDSAKLGRTRPASGLSGSCD